MIAARNVNTYSNFLTVKILIDLGANVNIQNDDGITALMFCTNNIFKDSSIQTVQLLIMNGANVNLGDEDEWTAAHLLMANRKNGDITDILKLLLDYGVNVLHKKNNGTIFDIACMDHNIEHMELILSYYDIESLKNEQIYTINYNDVIMKVFNSKLKQEKQKILNYERVLRLIPEHDAAVRYKIGNMGYKITKYEFDGIITDELLHYLDATPETLSQKVQEYLYGSK